VTQASAPPGGAATEVPVFRHFIAGEWVESTSGQTFESLSPADTRDVIGRFQSGTAADVAMAVRAADAAGPAWRRMPAPKRGEILYRFGQLMAEHKERLSREMTREMGKVIAEARGDVQEGIDIAFLMAGEGRRMFGDTVPSELPDKWAMSIRQPIGVAGIITPWNFPIAIPAWKIAPALAYGNTVVFKPAAPVPGSAWALSEIISRAGLPAGTFNLVMGSGSDIGPALVEDRRVAGVSFTGSIITGQSIAQVCAARLAKCQLEMGGKNPLVVLDDADVDLAAQIAVQGAFFSTGQRCTASSRLIVTDGIHDRFVDAVVARMARLTIDDARREGTDIGPVVHAGQLAQNLEYIEIGRGEGARLARGGERLERRTPGFYMAPALFTGATNAMRTSRDEIFGPVASVIRVRDYDEALAVANDTPMGLTAGIATTSLKYATHFKRHADAGMVMVNVPTAGVDFHVPFGGRKGSSYGPREQGRYAAEFYTTVKTAYTFAG
jgi:alpha-ketoglutaric semialdehyde dehydrogenase